MRSTGPGTGAGAGPGAGPGAVSEPDAAGRIGGPGEQLALFAEPGGALEVESSLSRSQTLMAGPGAGLGEAVARFGAVSGAPQQGGGCQLPGEASDGGAAVARQGHRQLGQDVQTQLGGEEEGGRRGCEEIAALFEIAGQEGETIARLTGSLEQLRSVQAAKDALARLTPAEVRAALGHRHLTLVPAPDAAATASPASTPGWPGCPQASDWQGYGQGYAQGSGREDRRGADGAPGAVVGSSGLEGA